MEQASSEQLPVQQIKSHSQIIREINASWDHYRNLLAQARSSESPGLAENALQARFEAEKREQAYLDFMKYFGVGPQLQVLPGKAEQEGTPPYEHQYSTYQLGDDHVVLKGSNKIVPLTQSEATILNSF